MPYSRRLLYIWADDEETGRAIREVLERYQPDLVIGELPLDLGQDAPSVSAEKAVQASAQHSTSARSEVPPLAAERLVRLLINASSLMEERIARVEGLARNILAQVKEGAIVQPDVDLRDTAVLQLDMAESRLVCGKQSVELTSSELRVARELLQASPRVLSREYLHQLLYGESWVPGKRSLDVHVARLRRKLAAVTDLLHLESVRGRGYRLRSGMPGGVAVLLDGVEEEQGSEAPPRGD